MKTVLTGRSSFEYNCNHVQKVKFIVLLGSLMNVCYEPFTGTFC